MALPAGPAAVVEIPGPWQHRYVAANGARFHVVQADPAPAESSTPAGAPLVLLLHGFPEFWWTWREQLPVLAEHGFRAVAMDLRGYGGSDKTPRGYDPLTLAADVAGVVKALGARRAVVVGQGWGGYVGWATAALHPRILTGLCTVSAPHPLEMLALARAAVRGGRRLPAISHLLAMQAPFFPERRLSRPASRYVAEHLRSWSSPASSFPDAEAIQRYHAALSLWPASHCALEYHRWLGRSRLRADGRQFNDLMARPIDVPICAIHGEDDPAIPPEGTALSARRVAGRFESHVLPRTGHFPHEEDASSFDTVLLSWLAQLDAA